MRTTMKLNKWGNSQGIIIPKTVCEQMNVGVGEMFELIFDGEEMVIRPYKEFTLESVMEGYDGPKPEPYDWGPPAGKELW